MSQDLKQTRLYQWHVDHGARMVPFAGWEMPVQYPTGPIEEHHLTRRSAGLFDIDHMGQFAISGPDAEAYLNELVTWDISRMQINEAHYALMCFENGGIVDDVFIYRLPAHWLVVVNADNLAKDYQWMQDHTDGYQVKVDDLSNDTYMIALQGPKAIALLQHLVTADLAAVARFTAIRVEVGQTEAVIGRTGYTGEDGVEIFFPADQAYFVWESILSTAERAGIEAGPIGLAARDSLRFEPAFALYGHEIASDITPLEANLRWVCSFDKSFIGKPALLAQQEAGLTKKLVGFELTEKGVPRQGYGVTDQAGNEIGYVATGLYAPTIKKYCGNAYVSLENARVGTNLRIVVRNKLKTAQVIKRPFYRPTYRK